METARAGFVVLLVALAGCRSTPASLAIGAQAPDFSLPGVDGKTHTLAEYASQPVLAVVFTCNHCPASQQYEQRIQKLHDDYRARGVAVVAISPNSPEALKPADFKYSDVGDSLADMKARADHRRLSYPYLYDGDAQAVSQAFKVVATPQMFVFDRQRKLQYEGRIDDNARASAVRTSDARNAIDALLAGQAVRVTHADAAGCPPAWKPAGAVAAPPAAGQIAVEMAGADALKQLRGNGTNKFLLVNFWATWCGPCVVEFPDLVMTSRMYRDRPIELVTVSENQPEEKEFVLAFLTRHSSAGRNLLFATSDTYGLQEAFDKDMPAALPFTLLIAPNGDVVFQELGSLDVMKMRRAILANLPDDGANPGVKAYWSGH